jgi:hypothetical protein
MIVAIIGDMPALERRLSIATKSGTAANVVPKPATKPNTSDRRSPGNNRQLVKRVGLDRARPLLIGTSPRAQLKALLDQRLPVYDRLAWRTVKTDDREPDEIAAEIAAVIEADAAGDGR